MNQLTNLPRGLSAVAGNRDLINTTEFAKVFNVQPQTVRKNYSIKGEVYGLKPIKIGNRLLWSVQQIAKKLKDAI